MLHIYKNTSVKRIPHNYFPAPKKPFVVNLASKDEQIRNTSIKHCIQGLELAKHANAPFFSAHAGFCIDPAPNELGKKIHYEGDLDKTLHWEIFLTSVAEVLQHAKKLQIRFLIENNVIARFNLTEDGQNPLFCCDSAEITALLKQVNQPELGLLLDTAHLKVSAQTLQLNLEQEVAKVWDCIEAVHHSDNDGLKDTNENITKEYWFLKHLPQLKSMLHVLEVKRQSVESINYQLGILSKNIGL
jgi:sugar phosphate isomerase/epimerase